jgi:hypothetical protein
MRLRQAYAVQGGDQDIGHLEARIVRDEVRSA